MSLLPQNGRLVVVGGGLAAAKAVEAALACGFEGTTVLVAAEAHLPYERPPLSKDYLRGEAEFAAQLVHDDAWYRERFVDVRTGVRAERIDREARRLVLEGGEQIAYDVLVLATGSVPRLPAIPGARARGVTVLRSKEDADALRGELRHGARLVVVGGGWIGLEAAASARALGAEVTVVIRGEEPLARVLGTELGRFYAALHEEHGVRLVRGDTVVEVLAPGGAVEGVLLASGQRLPADAVLFGIGADPAVGLAGGAGLELGDGVLVNEVFQTSDPAICAVGDIANYPHPRHGRLRVEHWDAALHQPATAVAALLGSPRAHDREPYFFSDQYDVGMEYVGHVPDPAATRVVIRGDLAAREFVALWLSAEDTLLASMNVNVWDVVDEVLPLIRSGVKLCPLRLADPTVPWDQTTADQRIPPAPPE
jgi:3-phenylpropionate/trans-cinnamate dioxygenase ferredoxin reductase component